jgi:hypothetical protein
LHKGLPLNDAGRGNFIPMTMKASTYLTLLLLPALASALPTYPSVSLPLGSLFDNVAASTNGSAASFDRQGGSFDSQFLPSGPFNYDGITVGHFSQIYLPSHRIFSVSTSIGLGLSGRQCHCKPTGRLPTRARICPRASFFVRRGSRR